MYSVIVSPPAEVDITEIQNYYDNLAFGLGEKFILRLSEVFELLSTHPKLYAAVEEEIRKSIMNEFPYAIFYSLEESAKEVEVIAVISTHRNPQYWKTRISLD